VCLKDWSFSSCEAFLVTTRSREKLQMEAATENPLDVLGKIKKSAGV